MELIDEHRPAVRRDLTQFAGTQQPFDHLIVVSSKRFEQTDARAAAGQLVTQVGSIAIDGEQQR